MGAVGMNSRIDALCEAAQRLARAGGEIADVFSERVSGASLLWEDGRVEAASLDEHDGTGLRIVAGPTTLTAHADRPGEKTLLALADTLARQTGKGLGDTCLAFTPTAPTHHATTRILRPFADKPLSDKAALAALADKAARGVDPRVRQVRVSYRDHLRDLFLVREDGRTVTQLQQGFFLSVLVVAAQGDLVQTGYDAMGGTLGWELFDEQSVESLAVGAAEQAVRMLSARIAPGGAMPVVLAASAGGTMIHEAVGHGLEADLVGDGHSIYADRVGEPVASPLVTVVDDPTLPGRRGSYIYDDEGEPAAPTTLVEKGILRGWLHSRVTAQQMGQEPSGNGRRDGFGQPPIPRMSNTYIAPGGDTPETILRDTERGLYVTRMGGGEVNTLSGDFVFEVSEGFLIEKGQIGDPVRGATITGNGPDALLSIDRVGSDLGFGIGTCGKDGQSAPVADAQPTLRIPELVVGGAVAG